MPKPPEPPEPPLHAAARLGDIAALERLVHDGHDVNARADLEVDNGPHLRGLTPLMVAARSIDGAGVETLRWLLDHGADLHARSEGTNTAAWYAAGKGGRWEFHVWRALPDHVERLRLLLDSGLDPREENYVGRSLLTEACEARDPARVRLLLERGASPKFTPGSRPVRERDEMERQLDELMRSSGVERPPPGTVRASFEIPLFLAAQSGSAQCVELLLGAGADMAERDDSGKTVLMHAGSAEVARLLIARGANPRERTPDGDDVLHVVLRGSCGGGACGTGRCDVARVLIEHGASLDEAGTKFENSRLYDAAFSHDLETVSFLLLMGRQASERDERGRTALHAICWQGEYADPDVNQRCEAIIRRLAEAGADVNAADDHGSTPLHEAVSGDWGNETAVRTLLSLGAVVESIDVYGCTPLMLAADSGEVKSIEALLKAGADPTKPDNAERTARTRAADHLATWREINSQAPEPILPGESPLEVAARNAAALRKAEEAHRLVHEESQDERPRRR